MLSYTLNQYQGHDTFALSWQAGIISSQGLPKSLKNYDIEAVDVINICEKLHLTLRDTSQCNNDCHFEEDTEGQCVVRKSNIPFRAITNIWFGTLKIYRQQVNNLFQLSKDLLLRSTNSNFNRLEATKRKSSLISSQLVKKRRLKINEPNEKILISTNYSELIDESEKLIQEPILNSLEELSNVMSNTRSVTQLQIREITIREISTSTFPTDNIVEDSGFGNATHEEIAHFFSFGADNFLHKNKSDVNITPAKRKASPVHQSPTKKFHYSHENYLPEQPIQNLNTATSKYHTNISPFKGLESPKEEESFNNSRIKQNINTLMIQNISDKQNNDTAANKIKEEYIEDSNFKLQNYNKNSNRKKKSKLIIDFCTKIDATEILDEMNKTKHLIKTCRKRVIKAYKTKKMATALELLTKSNRNFNRLSKISTIFKQKVCYSLEKFKRDYLSILRDILKINCNDKLASEIYPKWLCLHTPQKPKLSEQHETGSNNHNDYLNTVSTRINNNVEDELINDTDCGNSSFNICKQNEWRPYGVMMKVLNLWHWNQTTEIDANILLKLTENRFDKAACFYSLLSLSKNQFVVLTTFPQTITMQTIVMGEATKSVTNNMKILSYK